MKDSEPSKPRFYVINQGDKISLSLEGLSVEEIQKLQAELTRGIVEAIKHKFNKGNQ